MTRLEELKSATSLRDLAGLVHLKPSSLSFILYRIPESTKYTEFEIPKRGGGKRKIKAPEPRLKALQRRLANLLYDCQAEIENTPPLRKALSHGFCRGRSIITNASQHKKRRFVFNIDIEDFFPSINFGRVRGFFLKDKQFQLHPKVATVIAQIACHENGLPQGSPCSPVISNLLGKILDTRLVGIAKANKCTYSRYADDITFSTNQALFPTAVAYQTLQAPGGWDVGDDLRVGIEKSGFTINNSKTRMQVRGSRQLATGLLVNEKVNVRPEYYRNVRSMCAAVFSSGVYYKLLPATLTGGAVTDPPKKISIESLNSLQGMLEYVYYVKNTADRRTTKEKKEFPTAIRNLYRRFLHYKYFVALESPLVVTEGATDQIYLRAAIEKLVKHYPTLGSSSSGKFTSAVKFLRYSATTREILQLGGGTGDLKFLMLKHREFLRRFKHTPMAHPVIMIIDNDQGAGALFQTAKEISEISNITHESSNAFFRIYKNLYLIKTPSLQEKTQTCIEDFFDDSVLSIKINGKSFDPNKKHGDNSKYGKTIFAEKVVRPNKDKIDFSGFEPLLNRLSKALDDYSHNLGRQE